MKVLSTTIMMSPRLCTNSAQALMSVTFIIGLVGVSIQTSYEMNHNRLEEGIPLLGSSTSFMEEGEIKKEIANVFINGNSGGTAMVRKAIFTLKVFSTNERTCSEIYSQNYTFISFSISNLCHFKSGLRLGTPSTQLSLCFFYFNNFGQ